MLGVPLAIIGTPTTFSTIKNGDTFCLPSGGGAIGTGAPEWWIVRDVNGGNSSCERLSDGSYYGFPGSQNVWKADLQALASVSGF